MRFVALIIFLLVATGSWFFLGQEPPKPKTTDIHEYKRVVALAPSYCSSMEALGLGHLLVGISQECKSNRFPAAVIVGSFARPNFEAIFSLKPQIVLAVPHVIAQDSLRVMKDHKLEVLAMQPDSIADIKNINSTLAQKFNREKLGLKLNQQIDDALTIAKNNKKTQNKTILLAIAHQPLVVAGNGTYISEIFSAFGFINQASLSNTPWPVWPYEKLISFAPDYIFILDGKTGKSRYKNMINNLDPHSTIRFLAHEKSLLFSPSIEIVEDILIINELINQSL